MKALTFKVPDSGKGNPEVREIEFADPVPRDGEVLVRVHFAGLNYFDFERMQGKLNRGTAKALKRTPVISGIEMSGVAESDGERIKKGDKIVGYTNIFQGPFFHAEYVALPEKKLTRIPESQSLEGAASLVGGALTSINALERIASLQEGQKVLITAATGSVGVTAVQLASHLGAEVSGTCNSRQIDFAREHGATHVFAYDREEWPESENQFDAVFDTAPSLGFRAASKFLKPTGTYITTMPHLDVGGFARSLFSRRKWGYLMESDTDAKRMSRFRDLMEQGAFGAVIDSIYPLSAAVDAFERQQGKAKGGKILIDFRSGH